MSDKKTRRGIYLTEQQWADAKDAGDGNYSAGVRRRLDEQDTLNRQCTELGLQVDNLTVERDTLNREGDEEQTKLEQATTERDEASALLAARVFEVQELRAQVRPFPRLVFALGFLAACMAIAATLAVLEGIDKAWWGWTL